MKTEIYKILMKENIGIGKARRLSEELLNLHSVSERSNSIDFAKYVEALTPVNRISVHPSLRTLSVDEIYDKHKRQQERNAR